MTEERVAALEEKVDQLSEMVVGLCQVLGIKKIAPPQEAEGNITIETFGDDGEQP